MPPDRMPPPKERPPPMCPPPPCPAKPPPRIPPPPCTPPRCAQRGTAKNRANAAIEIRRRIQDDYSPERPKRVPRPCPAPVAGQGRDFDSQSVQKAEVKFPALSQTTRQG